MAFGKKTKEPVATVSDDDETVEFEPSRDLKAAAKKAAETFASASVPLERAILLIKERFPESRSRARVIDALKTKAATVDEMVEVIEEHMLESRPRERLVTDLRAMGNA